MDLTTVFLPGAQSLVTAILTDTWHQARTAVAKLWARRADGADEAVDAEAVDRAGRELDLARAQAVELAGAGTEDERADRMRLFWAGYLAGQAAARPDLASGLAELPALLAAFAPQTTTTFNSTMSGTVNGTVAQANNIANITVKH